MRGGRCLIPSGYQWSSKIGFQLFNQLIQRYFARNENVAFLKPYIFSTPWHLSRARNSYPNSESQCFNDSVNNQLFTLFESLGALLPSHVEAVAPIVGVFAEEGFLPVYPLPCLGVCEVFNAYFDQGTETKASDRARGKSKQEIMEEAISRVKN